MTETTLRSYPCKDEELPVISRYAVINVKRDLAEFSSFSLKYNLDFVTDWEAKISKAEELVAPESETAEMKKINARITASMTGLMGSLKKLDTYIEMANGSINLSTADFGLSELRKGINVGDHEKIIDRLKNVNQMVVKYKPALVEQGFSDKLQEKMVNTYTALSADRQLLYQTRSNRLALVQSNVWFLNALYAQLKLILKTGKALFEGTDPLKVREYTFTELKKRVRRVPKSNGKNDGEQPETPVAE
jgi:hypothetical protein